MAPVIPTPRFYQRDTGYENFALSRAYTIGLLGEETPRSRELILDSGADNLAAMRSEFPEFAIQTAVKEAAGIS